MSTIDRQALFDFLDSDDNEFGLNSVATHGFLLATIVGKPLTSWIDALFEDHTDKVDQAIQNALREWRDELLTQLKDENSIDLPFDDDEDEVDFSLQSDISAWAIGFTDAMYAENAQDWFDDQDTEDDVAMLTLPMIVLSGLDEEDETLQDLRSDKDILAQMVNSIETNLTELFLLFNTQE